MFIYKLTNTLNNKIYIGLTTEKISERCRKRNVEAKFRKERTSYILNAIRKYGEDKFKVEQIDTANNLEELKLKEIHYIKLYNSTNRKIGYNLTEGGEGNKGLKMSDKTKDKIRQKQLGKIRSKESIEKQKETNKKLNLDYTKGIENFKIYNLKTSKKVNKINLKGEIIKIFDNIGQAANDIGITRVTLSMQFKKYGKREKEGFTYKIKEN